MLSREIVLEAEIRNVEYTPTMVNKDILPEYSFEEFQRGEVTSGNFLLKMEDQCLAISRWVSPKRTRSYPFARIYDTLNYKNRLTVIPLVKDEGIGGERDYLQWDTVSLMSLLRVYVIIAYYASAEPHPKRKYQGKKITNQEFDYNYLTEKIKQFLHYQSDALHWNLNQMDNLQKIAKMCEQKYYEEISSELGVPMHSREYFKRKIEKIIADSEQFKQTSRKQAREAQSREVQTIQPKEQLITNSKAVLTIRNFLGGAYYFTTDECLINQDKIFLIEKKHTKRQLPSINDIKDGILKMVLFSNLDNVRGKKKEFKSTAILGLTAKKFPGIWTSWGVEDYESENLTNRNREILEKLKEEARVNGFYVFVLNSKLHKKQNELLKSLI
ncbi:MAG: hypothetical protein GF308_07670 [Candidatus Heimdallarchaeota archaeon]|nr:hypothetical protein [Candidatus Heimdallarchaeota archaeon]